MEHEELTGQIINAAMKVHSVLGPGFLESVYQNALAHELRKDGKAVECERKLTVLYDNVIVGDFSCDMLINEIIIIENKACRALTQAHEVQLVNYLTSTNMEIGLLLNFGAGRLEFKRKYRTCAPKIYKTKIRQDGQD